jgi:glycerophosphoryl diester phosphodiesterase
METRFPDIVRDGHRTRLKWHRARRRLSDAPFTVARIREGLAAGASVEIDVRIRRDGTVEIRHDPRRWWRPDAAPVGTLTDLADLAGLTGMSGTDGTMAAVGDALLQLDIKDSGAVLRRRMTARSREVVRQVLGQLGPAVILSAGDPAAVAVYSDALPAARTGTDPCTRANIRDLQRTGNIRGFVAATVAAAPGAATVYLDHRVVTGAADAGTDIVAAFHAEGMTVDAYVPTADDATVPLLERLLDLRVDQITTDDPEGVLHRLH